VGRYVFAILFFGAGMFNASTGKEEACQEILTLFNLFFFFI
jgi:hypothetical protein